MEPEFHRIRRLPPYVFAEVNALKSEVAVWPGVGFGEYCDGHVRFALVENEHWTRQEIRNIKAFLKSSDKLLEDWDRRKLTS